jgi:hypothetical protein
MFHPTVPFVIYVFWIHFVSDFVLQTDQMAKSKSTSNEWLTRHVLTYGVFFFIYLGPVYAIVNCVLHWITDYFSSRASSKLWKEGRVHDFFVVIGLDQAIHMTCLILTLPLVWWPFL